MNDYTLTFRTQPRIYNICNDRLYIINAKFAFFPGSLSREKNAPRGWFSTRRTNFSRLMEPIFPSFLLLPFPCFLASLHFAFLPRSRFQRVGPRRRSIFHGRRVHSRTIRFPMFATWSRRVAVTSVRFVIARARVTRLHRRTRRAADARD